MKNKLIVLICMSIVILFAIFVIYDISKNKKNKLKESEYNKINYTTYEATKNIRDIIEIRIPDEIVYYQGENKMVITKDSDNFERIINANRDRSLGELSRLELIANVETEGKHDFLEYKYNDDSSIYFSINTDKESYIWIPNNCTSFVGGAYGHIDTATELMKYLY